VDQPCSDLNAFIPNLEWRHPESCGIHFKDVILSPAFFSGAKDLAWTISN